MSVSGQAADRPDAFARGLGQGLLGRNIRAVLAAAAITLAVQLGTFYAARESMPAGTADVLTALLSALWVIIAAPVFAAGGGGLGDGLIRGGAVADAGAVVLIVLAAAGDAFGFRGALGLYLIWMSIALAESALVCLARRPASRHVVAAVAAGGVLAISAAPFWTNSAVLAARGPWRLWACRVIVAANPVFATSQCLSGEVEFVWNERPILYGHSVLGRDVPRPAVAWYVTASGYALVAAGLAGVGVIRRRRKRTPQPPPESVATG